jgi:hypothetical protein
MKVFACNKAGFFEMYKQAGSGTEVCLDTACIKMNGYAKSSNFPICVGGSSNSTPAVNFSLTVLSTPSGAVIINGTSYGATPKIVSLMQGSYLITVGATNYTSNSTMLTLSNNTTLNLTLQPIVISNSTGNVTASAIVSIAPWFPQGKSYVFKCNATGFTPTHYDFNFGNGQSNIGRTTNDVYYTYPVAGMFNVTCTARNVTFSRTGSMTVNVA